jgi:hypothetical protein
MKQIPISLISVVVSIPIVYSAELSLTYDANGNLVTGDGYYREYNSLNQLARIRNGTNSSGYLMQEYTYHPTEERVLVKKTYNSTGNLTETVYYIDENYVRVVGNNALHDGTMSCMIYKRSGEKAEYGVTPQSTKA